MIDLYDSDIDLIGKTWAELRLREGSTTDLDGFTSMAKDRFAKVGFEIDVKWWHTDQSGVYIPEIEVLGKLDPAEFDHDRMFREVTTDLLGLGEEGVVDFDGKVKSPAKSVSFHIPGSADTE